MWQDVRGTVRLFLVESEKWKVESGEKVLFFYVLLYTFSLFTFFLFLIENWMDYSLLFQKVVSLLPLFLGYRQI